MSGCDRTGCLKKAHRGINVHGNIYYWCREHIFNYFKPILSGRENKAIKAIQSYKYQTKDGFADLVRANPYCVGQVLERMKKTESEKT